VDSIRAGIAAVSGTIIARVAMGSVCDWIGPRLGMSAVLLTSSSFVFGTALANGPISFSLLRFGIGFGLSAFVACQFWTASMFNVKIVGAHLLLLFLTLDIPLTFYLHGICRVGWIAVAVDVLFKP
jgi:hypothetical protein